MEFVKKNTKTIAISAGLTFAAAIGLYFILKKSSKVGHKRARRQAAPKKPLTEEEKRNILSKVKIAYHGKYLTPHSVVALSQAMHDIGAVDLANLKLENRKLRRANKKNPAKYVRFCEDYCTAHMQHLLEKTNEVLNPFNISEGVWNESYNFYFDQKHPILMQHEEQGAMNAQKVLSPEIFLSIEEIKIIFKRSPQLVQEENVKIADLSKYLTIPQAFEMVQLNAVNDKIFEEFGVEEEDVFIAMEKYAPTLMAQGFFN